MTSKKLHIGVVAPAGYSEPALLAAGLARLEALGHKLSVHPHTHRREQIFAGSASERVHAVSEFLHNSDFDLVLTTRGIHGSQHILPELLAATYAPNTPPLVAFSDNTFLVNPLHFQKGLRCVYGPGVISIAEGLPDAELQHMLACATRAPNFSLAPLINDDTFVIRPGQAQGRVVAGNFFILCSMLGTSYDWPAAGTILFFEDLKQFLFRIDRMLIQLRDAGKLATLAGIVIGDFSGIITKGANHEYSIDVWDYLQDLFKDAPYPVIARAGFGHAGPMYSVPIGANVALKAELGQRPALELLSY